MTIRVYFKDDPYYVQYESATYGYKDRWLEISHYIDNKPYIALIPVFTVNYVECSYDDKQTSSI